MWSHIVSKLLELYLIIQKVYKFFCTLRKTYKRDFKCLLTLFRVLPIIKQIKTDNKPVYYYFEETVKRYPQKAAFLYESERWSFTDVKELSDKIAIYFEREGYQKGSSIALLLNNCPDHICIWLGLSQIGVVTALINTNLVNDSLIHSLKASNCAAVIFGSNFSEGITNYVKKRLNIKCYQYNRKIEATALAADCIDLRYGIGFIQSGENLRNSYKIVASDPLIYIYTSGTTGWPKAAILTHFKAGMYRSIAKAVLAKPQDAIIYCPLPLFHGSGAILGCGQALSWGSTVVLTKKFSASNYWRDCMKYNCNTAQYVGEMCRYIVKKCPEGNVKHPVQIMYGNGLKPHIWNQLLQKCNIKQIFEFYGATESNFGLINLDNTVGSIGFIPPYVQDSAIVQLVKYSEVSDAPLRNKNGFCIKSGVNEPGLAIALITQSNPKKPYRTYVGYTDPNETRTKILENVFENGDKYFNSGDVLMRDELGYYYFIDRLGDTFRWKGENVSTSEVEDVMSRAVGLEDAVLYGVKIPGCEGRAGMMSVSVDHKSLDTDNLLQMFKKNLPSYAIPLFIRCTTSLPSTLTFKLQKYQYKKEGFNVKEIKDVIYFYNQNLGKYVVLTQEIYDNIIEEKMGL